jgi:quinol monooxygenase YgiN
MAEVRLIARSTAREGKATELKELLKQLLKPTRAEAGCKLYELLESSQPGVYYFNELWESQAHLDAHMASNHFKKIFGQVNELVSVPLQVEFLKNAE